MNVIYKLLSNHIPRNILTRCVIIDNFDYYTAAKSFDKFCKSTIAQILYRRNLEMARILAAEDEGFDLIHERLGQALAGGARPRRI